MNCSISVPRNALPLPNSYILNIEITEPLSHEEEVELKKHKKKNGEGEEDELKSIEYIDWDEVFTDDFQAIFGGEIRCRNMIYKLVKDCEVEGQLKLSSCSILPTPAHFNYYDTQTLNLHVDSSSDSTTEQKFQKWVTRALVRLSYFFRGRGDRQVHIRAFKTHSPGASHPFTRKVIPLHGKKPHNTRINGFMDSTNRNDGSGNTGNCNHPSNRNCGCLWLNGLSVGTMLNRGVFVSFYSAQRSERDRLNCIFWHDELKLLIDVVPNPSASTECQSSNEDKKEYKFEIRYSSISSVVVDPCGFMDDLVNQQNSLGEKEDRCADIPNDQSAYIYLLLTHPPRLHQFVRQEESEKVTGPAKLITLREPSATESQSEDEETDFDMEAEEVAKPAVETDDRAVKNRSRLRLRTDHILDHPTKRLTREIFGNSETYALAFPVRDFRGNKKDDKRASQRSRVRFFELVGRLRTLLGDDRVIFTNIMQTHETPPPTCDLLLTAPVNFNNMYNLSYAITALLNLGYRTVRKLGRTEAQRQHFVQVMYDRARISDKSEIAADNALWMLFNALYRNTLFDIMMAFERLTTDYEDAPVDLSEELMYGNQLCMSVHKIVVTPSRMILLQKETIMGNRVLNHFVPATDAIRIQFKDDDFENLRLQIDTKDTGQVDMVKSIVRSVMVPSKDRLLQIGDKKFRLLAWSNSQMKDRGFYMSCKEVNGEVYGPRQLADELGTFKESTENLPKVLSRMAQCLTQARPTIVIEQSETMKVEDFEGGFNPEGSKPYCFSDGVGLISLDKVQQVAESFLREDDEQNYVPSALQIRWAGIKGMVTCDPLLNDVYPGAAMIYRDSMLKFDGDRFELEVAKPSKPGEVSLNHRLIMILDQVSKKQSVDCHDRIRRAIHAEVERQLFSLADMLCSEKKAIQRMENEGVNNPMQIQYHKLSAKEIKLTKDPFFRSQLMAIHKEILKRQTEKCQIALKKEWGRNVFGVVDYTGYLQPDEIFIQISENMDQPQSVDKDNQSRRNHIKLITGRVLVLKNPCMVAGDVRMLHAVAAPPLDHLVDVIVFSKFGHRPNPDEMAGSDLDGDEYGVIFGSTCPDLMLEHSELPMHFPSTAPDQTQFNLTEEEIYEFFLKSMTTTSMGQLANAHLVHADNMGLMTTDHVSKAIQESLAKKYSQALDFQKTGIPPEPITKEERALIHPDYRKKVDKPWYKSKWILGEIFRKSNQVAILSEACRKRTIHMTTTPQNPNPMLLRSKKVDDENTGRERFIEQAKKMRDAFNNQIQRIMDMYAIEDEAGLFCGHMDIETTRRIASGEKEDFNLYSTDTFVKKSVKRIVESFREQFFKSILSSPIPLGEEDPPMPSSDQMDLASAWYDVTYNPEYNQTNKRSFPWIVWDILLHVHGSWVYASNHEDTMKQHDAEPFLSALKKALQEKMGEINRDVYNETDEIKNKCDYYYFVDRVPFCDAYREAYGTDVRLIFMIFLKWAAETEKVVQSLEINGEKNDCTLRPQILLALFIDWASSHGPDDNMWAVDTTVATQARRSQGTPFLRNLQNVQNGNMTEEQERKLSQDITIDKEATPHWREKLILGFLKYLASDDFYRKDCIQLTCIDAALWHKELSALHRAAFVTYHKIALSGKLAPLTGTPIHDARERDDGWDNEEGPAQKVAIDWNNHGHIHEVEIEDMLKKWSNVDEISVRRSWGCRTSSDVEYLVVARGKPKARHALQNILVHDKLRDSLIKAQKPVDVAEQW